MYIIAGLGNPGEKYKFTRHNVGFLTIDELARRWNIKVNKIKFKGLVGEGNIKGEKVILIKPQTYMNLSGESLEEIISFYKIELKNLIVIYDDIDIEFGKLRVKPSGSSGSHNGMKSILYLLKSENFNRIRLGTGKPPEGIDLADYVLQNFSKEEMLVVEEMMGKATNAVETILLDGVEKAMNQYN